jgi:DNA-binding transcriptional MocR family regulator
MPLQAVETQRLYRQIADQLRDLMAGGEFKVGTRLPAGPCKSTSNKPTRGTAQVGAARRPLDSQKRASVFFTPRGDFRE